MGYFEGITANCFKTDKEGNTVFYPYGILGGGVIVPEDKKVNFRRHVAVFILLALPVAIASTMFLKWWLVLSAVLPFYLLVFTLWTKKSTVNFEKSGDKLTLSQGIFFPARSHNLISLWLAETVSALLVITAVLIFIISPQECRKGALLIAFFGITGLAGIKVIKGKRRTKDNRETF